MIATFLRFFEYVLLSSGRGEGLDSEAFVASIVEDHQDEREHLQSSYILSSACALASAFSLAPGMLNILVLWRYSIPLPLVRLLILDREPNGENRLMNQHDLVCGAVS